MKQTDNDFFERPWNMNARFLEQLDDRRTEKAKAAIGGDIWGWYRANMEIFSTIAPLLSPIEQAHLEKELMVLHGIFQNQEHQELYSHFAETQQMNRVTQAEKKLRELDKSIMKALFTYQLVYIKPKKKTVEEYLAEDDHLD